MSTSKHKSREKMKAIHEKIRRHSLVVEHGFKIEDLEVSSFSVSLKSMGTSHDAKEDIGISSKVEKSSDEADMIHMKLDDDGLPDHSSSTHDLDKKLLKRCLQQEATSENLLVRL